MKKMHNRILLFALLALAVTGCNLPGKPANFDYGTVENNQYTNSFFKFKISIPQDWKVQSKEQTEAMSKQGENLMAGDDEKMKKTLEASAINVANLLMAFKYEPGSVVEFNPSISLVAENVGHAIRVKNGADYLASTRTFLMQAKGVTYNHIDEKFQTEKIGSVDFHFMNTTISMAGMDINQRYYAAIINGFSFVSIITYTNEEQFNELKGILATAVFQ